MHMYRALSAHLNNLAMAERVQGGADLALRFRLCAEDFMIEVRAASLPSHLVDFLADDVKRIMYDLEHE
jgi:hypothetical protein